MSEIAKVAADVPSPPEPSVSTVLEGISRWAESNPGASVSMLVHRDGPIEAWLPFRAGPFSKRVVFASPASADEAYARLEAAVRPEDTP